jgi:hypothetical protein
MLQRKSEKQIDELKEQLNEANALTKEARRNEKMPQNENNHLQSENSRLKNENNHLKNLLTDKLIAPENLDKLITLYNPLEDEAKNTIDTREVNGKDIEKDEVKSSPKKLEDNLRKLLNDERFF